MHPNMVWQIIQTIQRKQYWSDDTISKPDTIEINRLPPTTAMIIYGLSNTIILTCSKKANSKPKNEDSDIETKIKNDLMIEMINISDFNLL